MTIKYTVAICALLSSWIHFSYATQDKKLEVTHKVWFAIEIGGQKAGSIEIGLFGKIVPRTVNNFVQLAQNPKGNGYEGSKFHRIIPNFAILGGDYINGDGTGGRSTYGLQFEAENFELKHYGPGWLSMRTTCKRTMNSQFFITLSKLTSLDGRNVVFGKVLEGMDVVRRIENTDINSQYRPVKDVIITESGAETILDPFEVIEEATEVNEFESFQNENKF